MKSTFERGLFESTQYAIVDENSNEIAMVSKKCDRMMSICEESFDAYKNKEITFDQLESITEGLFGAIGSALSWGQNKWNAGVQDFKDARMQGQLNAQNVRFQNLQRQREMILAQRKKMRMMREDPSQFTTTGTSKATLGDAAQTAQAATANAATAHTADVQKQDIDDTRQAALRAGTDMHGGKPVEAQEAEIQGMKAHDPEAVDDALTNVQNLLARANATTDPNERADLINQIYQASSAGAQQVQGRLDAMVNASKGGQTTRMHDGPRNKLATKGRRNQPSAGRMRGGRGKRMG